MIRSTFKLVPILACTATATVLVAKDIIKTLNMRNPVEIKSSFNRPNIYYKIVWSTSLIQNEEKELLQFIRKLGRGRGGIIYCSTRAGCENLSQFLTNSGICIGVYHAGLPNRERERVQSAWETSEIDIVVATIAFGMGIHREDVSFIIHMNMPKSIENYYQETGRAGRNGKPSVAILFYSKQDENRQRNLLRRESQNSNMIKLLEDMIGLCTEPRCHRQKILSYFGEKWDPVSPPKICCNFCDDPSQFRQSPSEQESKSSVRGILALTSKRRRKGTVQDAAISLIDDNNPDDEESDGIYRPKTICSASSVTPKRRKPLTVDITDVQRSLCRRRIFSALKRNRAAADSQEDEPSLNAFSENLEQSLFASSSVKSEYMEKSRKLVATIQSFSNGLCLFHGSEETVPTLDLDVVKKRLCRFRSAISKSKEMLDVGDLEPIIDALGKCFMTLDKLRSSGIGRDVNDLIKALRSANLHLTHQKTFNDLSALLSRWKDLVRQDSSSSPG